MTGNPTFVVAVLLCAAALSFAQCGAIHCAKDIQKSGNFVSAKGSGNVSEHLESSDPYQSIGCFGDIYNRSAIPTLEGKDPILDGIFLERLDPIKKCYQVASKRGFRVFAVGKGGWCSSSSSAVTTFDRYGRSSACREDGKGGIFANEVYYIKGYETIGCYKDEGNRAIQTLEGKDDILDGPHKFRSNSIAKCAVAAMKAGYSMFAVQDGGWCVSSATAPQTFDKYGKSRACQADGEGGGWANQVYFLTCN